MADQVPLRESGGAAQAWGWAGGWAARADEASLADKKGWEYTGLKGALAGRRARKAVWVGEPFAGALFRRRCWERTQRRYLNARTADAARVQRELAARTVGLAELQGFCGLLGVKSPWAVESLRDSPRSNVLKDIYDYSCFLARWNEYHRLMT